MLITPTKPFNSDSVHNYIDSSNSDTPSVFQSGWNAFKSSFATGATGTLYLSELPRAVLDHTKDGFAPLDAFQDVGTPDYNAATGTQGGIDALNAITDKANALRSQEAGFGEKTADLVGNILGYGLNPLTFVGDGAGSFVGENVGSSLMGMAPEAAQPILQSALRGGGALSGALLPSDVVENYDNDTQSIKWGGVATDVGENFGIGMALSPVHYLLGNLWAKIKAKRSDDDIFETAPTSSILKQITRAHEDGTINDAERDFLNAYYTKTPNVELLTKAKSAIATSNPDILSADGDIKVPLYTNKDISNLHHYATVEHGDAIAGYSRTPLTDFTRDKALAALSEKQDILNGFHGLRFHVEQSLEKQGFVEKRLTVALNKALDKLPNDNAALSQRAIFGESRDGKYTGILPKAVKDKLTKDKNTPLMGYHDELHLIQKELYPDDKLRPDYKSSEPYQRLLQMMRPDTKNAEAKRLLLKTMLDGDSSKQQAYSDLATSILDRLNKAGTPIIDHTLPVDYMKAIHNEAKENNTDSRQNANDTNNAQQDMDIELPMFGSQWENAKELKKSIGTAVERYHHLKDSVAFDALEKCMGDKL